MHSRRSPSDSFIISFESSNRVDIRFAVFHFLDWFLELNSWQSFSNLNAFSAFFTQVRTFWRTCRYRIKTALQLSFWCDHFFQSTNTDNRPKKLISFIWLHTKIITKTKQFKLVWRTRKGLKILLWFVIFYHQNGSRLRFHIYDKSEGLVKQPIKSQKKYPS